jgi:hypothetical protein
MLPNSFSGSYSAYKADTNIFTTWLSIKARTLGFNLAENSDTKAPTHPKAQGPRLKGKARKEAKLANTSKTGGHMPRVIGTKELLEQARYIAEAGEPSFRAPIVIENALRGSIAARTHCSE